MQSLVIIITDKFVPIQLVITLGSKNDQPKVPSFIQQRIFPTRDEIIITINETIFLKTRKEKDEIILN